MMKAVIGMIPSVDEEKGIYFISKDNINALTKADCMPIMFPYQLSDVYVDYMVETIDGLYLTGGNDIDPTFFGEEPHPQLGEINRTRDEFEMMVIRKMLVVNKPILAVCRGAQILNIALHGDMYQDIYSQIEKPLLQHNQKASKSHASHFVDVEKNSLLYRLVKNKRIKVNSRHHQANRKLGMNLIASGKSSDGIIEAIESNEKKFVLGVQWHPENMITNENHSSQNIFNGFIEACLEVKKDEDY